MFSKNLMFVSSSVQLVILTTIGYSLVLDKRTFKSGLRYFILSFPNKKKNQGFHEFETKIFILKKTCSTSIQG